MRRLTRQRIATRGGAAILALALIAGGAVTSRVIGVGPNRRQSFPHERHARLFPVCTGCHEGIESGDSARFFPSPQMCANCHDGENQKRVVWTGPERRASNLRFTHPRHTAGLRDTTLACRSCHTSPGAERMAVQRAVVGRCLSCHQHQATSHYLDAKCETCHVPLAATSFAAERILTLPEPADHDSAQFLASLHGAEAHGGTARCATCHTRERCASCHVDAAASPAIARLPAAPAGMDLPTFSPHYPVPPTHTKADWLQLHGSKAGTAECATCHAREDCQTCHQENAPAVVASLPSRSRTSAPGVMLSRTPPASHSAPTWGTEHGTLAAASTASCTTCHTRRFCSECHDAAQIAQNRVEGSMPVSGTDRSPRATDRGQFHPPDFMARHAAQAWGRRLECANCHQVAVFCRDCHLQEGMGTEGRLGGAFHDAQPLWLLRHGQAARQGLESCTSCHRQRDCLQCHSTLGAFKVNPHGPGFDAARAHKKNPVICFACHATDPLAGSNP